MSLSRAQIGVVAAAVAILLAVVGIRVRSTIQSGREPVRLLQPPVHNAAVPRTITVDVSGEVLNPGVYTLPLGSRVQHAIAAAGGFGAWADRNSVNQAAPLLDGDKVFVGRISPTTPVVPAGNRPQASGPKLPRVVSLNRGTVQELEQLPGVGSVLAQNIVNYRMQHGNFLRIDDLQHVPGFGARKLEAVRPYVTL